MKTRSSPNQFHKSILTEYKKQNYILAGILGVWVFILFIISFVFFSAI